MSIINPMPTNKENRICPNCKNTLDSSAFSWYGDICNGCGALNGERLKEKIEGILGEFDKRYMDKNSASGVNTCFGNQLRMNKDIMKWLPQSLKQFAQEITEEMLVEVDKSLELHTHNSNPSYTADFEDGCRTCIKNKYVEEVLQAIKAKRDRLLK